MVSDHALLHSYPTTDSNSSTAGMIWVTLNMPSAANCPGISHCLESGHPDCLFVFVILLCFCDHVCSLASSQINLISGSRNVSLNLPGGSTLEWDTERGLLCLTPLVTYVSWCMQDFSSFSEHLHQFTRGQYMDALSDLHLLVYLATCDMLPVKVCHYHSMPPQHLFWVCLCSTVASRKKIPSLDENFS